MKQWLKEQNDINGIQKKNQYDNETVNSPNPLARFSHRSRVRKSYDIVMPRLSEGKLLDYGCGTGVLLNKIKLSQNKYEGEYYGYEPFLKERCAENLPIFSDYDEIIKLAPFATITVFEVFEHLQWKEISTALNQFKKILKEDGKIYISVPIEIGPALILKEMNRKRLTGNFQYNFLEFIGAAFFGIPGYREEPDSDYMSHKGFDFRHFIRFSKSHGWKVKVLEYVPLPIPLWYGNSQVFLSLSR